MAERKVVTKRRKLDTVRGHSVQSGGPTSTKHQNPRRSTMIKPMVSRSKSKIMSVFSQLCIGPSPLTIHGGTGLCLLRNGKRSP